MTKKERNTAYYQKYKYVLSAKRKSHSLTEEGKAKNKVRWQLYMIRHKIEYNQRRRAKVRVFTEKQLVSKRLSNKKWRNQNKEKESARKKRWESKHLRHSYSKTYKPKTYKPIDKDVKHQWYVNRLQKNPILNLKDSWKKELLQWEPELREARLSLAEARKQSGAVRCSKNPKHREVWQLLKEVLRREGILPT